MKKLLILTAIVCAVNALSAQYVYTIKADSVKITNNCDTAELILENHTQNVLGFLYNKGKGRTEFRKVIRVNDSTLIIGEDTMLLRGSLNAWKLTGNAGTNPSNNFVGTVDTQALVFKTNNLQRMRIFNNGNITVGNSTTDNGRLLQVNGTSLFNNDIRILHPTFATGGQGGNLLWVANNTFRISGGPQEHLTFGPANSITSNGLFVAPTFYGTTPAASFMVTGAGGTYSTMNNPANQNIIIHKFTSAGFQPTSGNGHPTLMELNMPVNRGETDGLETALRIKFTVTGTASALRALETVDGNVKLNTNSGLTSIGVDSASVITSKLDVNGAQGYNQLRLRKNYTPSGTGDSNGNTGDISWDDSYLYMKTSGGWKRVAWSTF